MTPYYFFFDGLGQAASPAARAFGIGGSSITDQYQFATLTVSQALTKQTGGTPTGSGIGGGGLPV